MDDERWESDHSPLLLTLASSAARHHRGLIGVTAAVVVIAAAAAIAVFMTAPRQIEARCRFRLEFNGAERGLYPNGTRFTPEEILAAPTLRRVYADSDLAAAGVTFDEMKRGLYVIESDPGLERLRQEYALRLEGTRLSVDRDRVESEYALRKTNFATREYTIVLALPLRKNVTPEMLERVVQSTLSTWAATIGRQKAQLDAPMMSVGEVSTDLISAAQPLLALEFLRSKTISATDSASTLARLDAAGAAVDPQTSLSARGIENRLIDVLRWQIDPLEQQYLRRGVDQETFDALSAQIAYAGERQVFANGRADAIRDGFAMYREQPPHSGATPATPAETQRRDSSRDAVVAQLDASALDRLVGLSAESADRAFRQNLTSRLIGERMDNIPNRIEVEHFKQLLAEASKWPRAPHREATAQDVAQVRAVAESVRALVAATGRVAGALSAARTASGTLYTTVEPPSARTVTFWPRLRLIIAAVAPFAALALFFIWIVLRDLVAPPQEERKPAGSAIPAKADA